MRVEHGEAIEGAYVQENAIFDRKWLKKGSILRFREFSVNDSKMCFKGKFWTTDKLHLNTAKILREAAFWGI